MHRSILLLLILFFSSSANASTARRASLKELISYSSTVAVGTIIDKASHWEGTRIYTSWEFVLEDLWLQGDTVDPKKLTLPASSPTILVKTLGGIVGDIGQYVAGTAPLLKGHTYLLFLTKTDSNTFHIVGLSQGAFAVDGENVVQLSNVGSLNLVGDSQVIPTNQTKLRQAIIAVKRKQPW